jgi:type IV pilus assembly protein PilB
MDNFDTQLYEVLKKSGFIEAQALDDAYKASTDINKPLSDILIFRGLCSEEMLGQLIADSLKVPYVSLKNRIIPDEILLLFPENLARRYRIVPYETSESTITIATDDPEDIEAMETVRKRTGLEVKISYATKGEISKALNQYKRDFKKKFETIVSENAKKASTLKEFTIEQLIQVAQDIPVVKTFDALLEYAVAENASDIHIELGGESVLIRLRIDGVLHDIINLPKEIHPAIIARIKVLSNLKIDEHRVPQDGRFRFQIDENLIALRVSIIPGFYGENVVMRLLPESSRPLSMEELGITGRNNELLKENIRKPYGMILVTGPTGSGKTTTLYSVLNILNTPRVKICTVEDPVEYGIARVNQIQVNPKTKLTFAAGLRALLRHDPDIIMVGEIRDEETASIAIHSALTGHLVLSTIHTNNAISTLARFIDMGAQPYLLTSTLNVVIAQRLVRRICSACISEYIPSPEVVRRLAAAQKNKTNKKNGMKFFKGKGCIECRNTGFKGRIGVYEVLSVDDEVRELILKGASEKDIRDTVERKGMKYMFDDGLDKVQAGLTTIEEVLAAVTT